MKLLITTQAVDQEDPVLGFFHGWLLEFAKHFERIDVICLKEGTHALPAHVFVHSLGKEKGVNYVRYVYRLFAYIWRLRMHYDVVFSHMNPHYIVLAGWLWALQGKRMYFWRNHARMNVMTRVAACFARRVFYTSPYACTRVFPHAVQMPVGIDTQFFTPQSIEPVPDSILLLGRLSPVKRPEVYIATGALLPRYTFDIYGDVPNGDHAYRSTLEASATHNVHFCGAISHYETPLVYARHALYVNLTPEGSMDKTVLEAAACGTLVLVSNTSFHGYVPEECLVSDGHPEKIAERIITLNSLTPEKRQEYIRALRESVVEHHSLQKLAQMLVKAFTL